MISWREDQVCGSNDASVRARFSWSLAVRGKGGGSEEVVGEGEGADIWGWNGVDWFRSLLVRV